MIYFTSKFKKSKLDGVGIVVQGNGGNTAPNLAHSCSDTGRLWRQGVLDFKPN